MDKNKQALNIFGSFGYQFTKKNPYIRTGINYWHPGFAYACTRKVYDKMNGLFELGILGAGDNIMALSFINNSESATNILYTDDYNNSILEYQVKASKLRLGYTPGIIRHHYHGSKKNRNYTERWIILIKHNYSPTEHTSYDKMGVLQPSDKFSDCFKEDILNYFKERKEDE